MAAGNEVHADTLSRLLQRLQAHTQLHLPLCDLPLGGESFCSLLACILLSGKYFLKKSLSYCPEPLPGTSWMQNMELTGSGQWRKSLEVKAEGGLLTEGRKLKLQDKQGKGVPFWIRKNPVKEIVSRVETLGTSSSFSLATKKGRRQTSEGQEEQATGLRGKGRRLYR